MSLKIGDNITIKKLRHIAPIWYGKHGTVVSIVGELVPFMYTVRIPIQGELVQSHELALKGDEIIREG